MGGLLQGMGDQAEVGKVFPSVIQVALAGVGTQAGQGRQAAARQVNGHGYPAGQLRIVQVADHRGMTPIDQTLQDSFALGQV